MRSSRSWKVKFGLFKLISQPRESMRTLRAHAVTRWYTEVLWCREGTHCPLVSEHRAERKERKEEKGRGEERNQRGCTAIPRTCKPNHGSQIEKQKRSHHEEAHICGNPRSAFTSSHHSLSLSLSLVLPCIYIYIRLLRDDDTTKKRTVIKEDRNRLLNRS